MLFLTVNVDQDAVVPENDNADQSLEVTPDEELLLFLADWSDENEQWLDPETFNETEQQKIKFEYKFEQENENYPDNN